jgi:hypothetical protein
MAAVYIGLIFTGLIICCCLSMATSDYGPVNRPQHAAVERQGPS